MSIRTWMLAASLLTGGCAAPTWFQSPQVSSEARISDKEAPPVAEGKTEPAAAVISDEEPLAEAAAPEPEPRQLQTRRARQEQGLLDNAERQWRDGDVRGCEQSLEKLLRHQPANSAARLMLADLHASEGNLRRAEQELQQLLAEDSQHAQAHHSLGLLLEERGQFAEALEHYHEACRLAPDNDLYRLSLGGNDGS